MNFDFNEKEQQFFKEITDLSRNFPKDLNLDGKKPQQTRKALLDALSHLSQTAYLKLCIEENPDMDGSILLMKAMEIIASVSSSLLMSVEMRA